MNLRTLVGSWFAPMLVHNHNQSTAMIRAASAKLQGLDPAIYGVPLPGSNVTTNYNGGGWIKGLILGAALLGGGACVAGLMSGPKPLAIPAAPATDQDWDAITEQQQLDGTWKQIRRERLPKGMP